MPATAKRGSPRIDHREYSSSGAQECQIFDMGRLPLAIECHDQRKSHRNFGGGDGNNEKDHHLAVEIVRVPREGHQCQIGCIKHQLERHVDDEQIAAHNHSEQSKQEQTGAHKEDMFEGHVHHSSSLLLKRIAPTIATSSSTETISNCSRY